MSHPTSRAVPCAGPPAARGRSLGRLRNATPALAVLLVIGLAALTPPAALATPPKLTPAELKKWNNPKKVGKNNCYNYAANNQNDDYAQPGWTDINQRQRVDGAGLLPDKQDYCDDVISRANKEGFNVVTGSATPGDPEPADSNLVALVVGNIGDYHWYRRDRNGKWTHKPGGGTARDYYRRRLPGGGVERGVVTDPRNKNQIQPYDTFCAYMKVVKPAPTIVGESVDPAHTSIPSSGLRCTRLVYSGIPDPYHDVVGPEADEIIQLIPTLNECLANAVPDPNLGENSLWTAPIGQHATDVEPGAARASEMPPLVRVAAGVVGFYYDDEETDPIFCSDIHDLQSALTPPTPGMSTWGLIALAALLPLGAIVILMSRRTAVA